MVQGSEGHHWKSTTFYKHNNNNTRQGYLSRKAADNLYTCLTGAAASASEKFDKHCSFSKL
jgi:hypothetical protein